MAGSFRDFIPAGEDTGALGSGFKDFVPAAFPTPQAEEVLIQDSVEPEVRVEKTNKELKEEAIALGINTTKLTNKKKLVEAIEAAKAVLPEPVVETPVVENETISEELAVKPKVESEESKKSEVV